MIQVVIMDDNLLLREGIKSLLETNSQIKVIGMATTLSEITKIISKNCPDTVLINVRRGEAEYIKTLRKIRTSNAETYCLAICKSLDGIKIHNLIKQGTRGILMGNASAEQMLEAVVAVSNGRVWLQPELTETLLLELAETVPSDTDPLTKKEIQIVKLVSEGYTNKEIANTLNLSESTIKIHVTNILRKLHLKNRSQITRYAISQHWVEI